MNYYPYIYYNGHYVELSMDGIDVQYITKGKLLLDKDGYQVWNEEEATRKVHIPRQERKVIAMKYFKNKPNENGEREPFYHIITDVFDMINEFGEKEAMLHNIHYATNPFY